MIRRPTIFTRPDTLVPYTRLVRSKSHENPVSYVDLAVDARRKAVLGAMVPEAGWLSEETADNADRLSRRAMWCVDPIDGTRDFIRGRPGWAVSVALVVDGAPELGVLYAPALDELWVARRGPARKSTRLNSSH